MSTEHVHIDIHQPVIEGFWVRLLSSFSQHVYAQLIHLDAYGRSLHLFEPVTHHMAPCRSTGVHTWSAGQFDVGCKQRRRVPSSSAKGFLVSAFGFQIRFRPRLLDQELGFPLDGSFQIFWPKDLTYSKQGPTKNNEARSCGKGPENIQGRVG